MRTTVLRALRANLHWLIALAVVLAVLGVFIVLTGHGQGQGGMEPAPAQL